MFAKLITPNEDSGRHGVVIPVGAYSFFPEFDGFVPGTAVNYTLSISTFWRTEAGLERRNSNFKHYHRYPERRITALGSEKLDRAPVASLIVLGRRRGSPTSFDVEVLYPSDPHYREALRQLGFVADQSGLFILERAWNSAETPTDSDALRELISRFDTLKSLGYVPGSRKGSTGVGHTFEKHMGVVENNRSSADYKGIELKAIRKTDFDRESPDRTNLFLKEPTWLDGLGRMSDRVRAYGYVDDDEREALYSCVAVGSNTHGLALRMSPAESRVYLEYNGAAVAYYTFAVLQKRLEEKLSEMLVGMASSRKNGTEESFFYHTAIFCANPSLEEFVSLIESGDVMLEIRMHVNEKGGCRNHGTCFRVKMNKWPQLFASVRELRTN